jgi:membrane fusion protein, multidrug efflux system
MSLDAVETAPPAAAEAEALPVLRGTGPASAGRAAGRGETRAWHRRPTRLLPMLAVAAALIAGGVWWWLGARQWVTTDDAFIDVHMVHIAPEVAGRVARVLVDDNQQVAAGQLLVALDPATYRAKVDQAVANWAAAAGSLAEARAQRAADIADEEEARAEVGVAEANAANAAGQLKRTQSLVERQFASRQQLDNDLAGAHGTTSTLVAAQKKLAAAGAQLEVAASRIATAKANLDSAAAQQAEARLDLAYTWIVAPVAGRVAHQSVATGDYLEVGQNLMAVVPLKVWVTANFKETELDRMRVGQPVEIRIDSYPDKVFHGRVDSFEAGSGTAFSLLPPENATGNYVKVVQRVPVKIVFDDPPDPQFRLGPGMSVVPSVKLR